MKQHSKSFVIARSAVSMASIYAFAWILCGPVQAQSATNAMSPSAFKPSKPSLVEQYDGARFNFSVSDLPAAQAFALLGTSTSYNVIVPSGLEGRITISLKNVTMLETLQSLSEAYGFDYKVQGMRVVILPNAISTRIFKINYLVGNRQGESSVQVQSSSFNQMPGNGGIANAGLPFNANGVNGNNGNTSILGPNSQRSRDSSRVSTNSDTDFWRDVGITLNAMVSGEGRLVTLNPAAGVLVIKGFPKEIALVEDYLKAVQISVQRQVMVEAKIIEVNLSNGSQSGVNWSAFGGGRNKFQIGSVTPGVTLNQNGVQTTGDVSLGGAVSTGLSVATRALGTGFYGLAFQGANFAAILNFLESQGGVQVLSSPRIATLNNQKALLKVGSDEFYVTNVTTSSTTSGTSTVTSPSISLAPFFSGISLDVTPQIDVDGMVTMHVHPSITNVNEKQKLVDLGSLGQFQLPSAASSVNETDSVVRIRSGQIAAIGGLMTQATANSKSGLPGISEAPVVGALFGQKSENSRKHEIVILIKPTVIEEGDDQALTEDEVIGGSMQMLKPQPSTMSSPLITGKADKSHNPNALSSRSNNR